MQEISKSFFLLFTSLHVLRRLLKFLKISEILDNRFNYYHNEKVMKKEILKEIKNFLLCKNEILFAYLAGTFLDKDDFNDIDIAVFLVEKWLKRINTVDYEIEMSLKMEDQVKPGEKLKRYVPVDVKVINCAPVSFKYSVTRSSLLFSRDEEKREDFLCRTWKEYFDFQYMSKIYLREVLNASVKY